MSRSRLERRFAVVPVFARPTLWTHATQAEHAGLRAWLDRELRQLDDALRREFVSRLRDEARYTGALAELAAGHVLRQPGYTVEYGVKLDGLTPDILLTEPGGRQLIAEVWRRGLSDGVSAQNSRWMELTRQLRRIRVPVALAVDSVGRGVAKPPDEHTRPKIAQAVRRWLQTRETVRSAVLETEGLRFRIVGTGLQGRTELMPVRTGSAANRALVIDAINQKVKRYRDLVTQLELPLVVVLSADEETGLDCNHVDGILAGKDSISIAIPLYGVGAIETGPITMLQDEAPPAFDPALSGVAWLDVNGGVHAELTGFWPMHSAARPVAKLDRPDPSEPSTDPPD